MNTEHDVAACVGVVVAVPAVTLELERGHREAVVLHVRVDRVDGRSVGTRRDRGVSLARASEGQNPRAFFVQCCWGHSICGVPPFVVS